MRRSWMFVIGLIIGLGLPGLDAEADQATKSWAVGYGEADITPAPMQVQISGFGRERYAKGSLAPLLTQAVALRDQKGRTALLITADILDFDRVMVEVVRRSITRKHHIPPENILLAASHTHWGPAVRFRMSFSVGGPNVWYMGHMEDQILASVDAALKDLHTATLEYGWLDFRAIGANRRFPRDGKITWGAYAQGSFDGHTPILRIMRPQSPHQIIMVGHACHPTSSGNIEKWSPGYPGAMRDYLVTNLPETRAMFVQGCGADAKVVHEDPETGKLVFTADPDRARAAGERLGQAVLDYLRKDAMTALTGSLACTMATGQLSYGKRWSQEETERQAYEGSNKTWMTWAARQCLAFPTHSDSESFRYDVQVWKLGNALTLFAMEGEVCSPWGPMLRGMAGTDKAMVIAYANSTSCYIPDQRILREGGYEALSSQQVYSLPAPFTENIDREIKAIVTSALKQVK
jgi:neutral ceramidase